MSNRTLYERAERFDALLGMIEEDGETRAGETPPAEYIRALRDVPLGRADEVRSAHAEGRGPPEWAGSPGNARGNGQGGGN